MPRRYLALPVSRVSSIVELALADTTRAPVGNVAFQPSLRDVRLRHRDGTEQSADLLRYLTTGETVHNPYVQDGDVIFVWSFGATPEIAQANQAGLEQMKTDPLWLQLNAVQQGKVYEVGHYWNSGSPLTASLVLDDLLEYLADK